MENEELENTSGQKIVRRIIKYDVPDNQKYSDTVEELPFIRSMSGTDYLPTDGTTFDEINVDEIMHVDGMHPDISVIPKKRNVSPNDEDETVIVHFIPDDNSRQENNDEKNEKKESDALKPENEDNDISNEPSKENNNQLDNAQIEQKEEKDSSEENLANKEFEEQKAKEDEKQKLAEETVPQSLDAYLVSLNFPTKRSESIFTQKNEYIKLIPLHQDQAWLRTIPKVSQMLEQFKQIGEAKVASGSYDIWYYRH